MLISRPANVVYRLSSRLAREPDQIKRAQDLTLDSTRPNLGLQGKYGLFGSEQWWKSIKDGSMETRTDVGKIVKIYRAGQDAEDDEGCDFDYVTDDGTTRSASCMANNAADLSLYQIGAQVELIYALDPLKKQPADDGREAVASILLQVAVE